MPGMSLDEAIGRLRAGDVVAARACLGAIAAGPSAHGVTDGDGRVAFTLACEIASLPDSFPPHLRAALADGLRTGHLEDALARLRDRLDVEPAVAEALVAIHIHAPVLHRLLVREEVPGAEERSSRLNHRLVWLVLMLGMVLLRACPSVL